MNSSPNTSDALRISQLAMRFSDDSPDVLRIPELAISSGDFVSIIGASGCGKSTLLRLIAGILSPTSGEVEKIASHRELGGAATGMVFQHPNLVPWRTTAQNISLPAELGRRTSSVDDDRISELLKLVGLNSADRSKRPSELSGGMQMRVSLARAFALSPSLLLMDEPFGAVDDVLRMQLEEDVRRIHENQQLTTVLVTHNISQAIFMSDRILVLGETEEGSTASGIVADIEVSLDGARDHSLRQSQTFHDLQFQVTSSFQIAAGRLVSNSRSRAAAT